jgi:hypothetical protein
MKISMLNAVRGLGEYVSEEISKMPFSWANMAASMLAQYKLSTQGASMLKLLDNGEGYIDLDRLSEIITQHADYFKDETFKTAIGEMTISKDTPQQILEHLKKYGE